MSALSRTYTERDGSEFQAYAHFSIEYRDKSHRYWIHQNGERIPAVSVTAALKVLDKPALLQWAEAAGAEGAILLERQGALKGVEPAEVIQKVRDHSLGMEAKRDAGAGRGTAVHNVLELWAREQTVPNVGNFQPELRGYVQGLCRFLLEHRPTPRYVERFVGSPKHGYAGRLDMRGQLHSSDTLIDLKTNPAGRVYDEAHLQARAYALAEVECGHPVPERIVIVAVGEDGRYEVVDCAARERDWLSVLECYRALSAVRAARKAQARIAQLQMEEAA